MKEQRFKKLIHSRGLILTENEIKYLLDFINDYMIRDVAVEAIINKSSNFKKREKFFNEYEYIYNKLVSTAKH